METFWRPEELSKPPDCQSRYSRISPVYSVTISFVMSVCPSMQMSVCMEQLGSHWTDFHDSWVFLENCWENSGFIKIWHELRVLYMKTNIYFWSYLSHFFLEWEMFQTKVVEKIATHVLNSKTFLKNRTVYGIMWKNTVEPDRPQMTTRRMRITCWIHKATNMHSECVILTALPLQQWLHEFSSVLCCTYIVCLVCRWLWLKL
jgi:hypothetical protein